MEKHVKILVIYAHPNHESHSKYTLELVEENLKSKNMDYEVIDLYKIGYNPVLNNDELYNEKISEETLMFQKKIADSDLLIFVYPIWWNSMPAILKGFIDRVFSAKYAFKYEPIIPKGVKGIIDNCLRLFHYRFNYGKPVGLLKDKRAIIFVSTGGPKIIAYPWTGDRFKKLIQKDMLGFFGIKSRLYQVSGAYKLDDYQKSRVRRNVERASRYFR